MNVIKEWQSFLRRISTEFPVDDYSIYEGNGFDMQLLTGVPVPTYFLEECLSYSKTMINNRSDGCYMVSQFRVNSTLYLMILHSNQAMSITENEVVYILRDMVSLQEKLNGKE